MNKNSSTKSRVGALRLSRAVVTSGLWIVLCFSVVLGAEDAGKYPGKLGIDKNATLSLEQRQVEARFAAYLEANTDEAISRYIEKFGSEIDVDAVRELSPDYAPGGINAMDPGTVAARTRWGEAVHEPASALTKEIYRRALRKETAPDRRRQVVFTAGGPGAGKTTSIRTLAVLSPAVDAAEIVYDTTLSTLRSALDRIIQALDAGRMVSIVFVYRDPIDSLVEGVLPRARITGRTVPFAVILNAHLRVPEAILRIAELFKNDPRVALAIVDNRDSTGNASIADLAFVERMGRKYTRETLQAALLGALEEAYEKGQKGDKNGISESIYRAIKGNAP
jgi:hypothetical protein